jgi:metal-sulfur cluster biosynthetic enzyme
MQDEPTFDYEGPPELRETVVRALRKVIDPELALDIVDVGLVYAVRIAPEAAHVRMTMTSAACPMADMIVDDVHTELRAALPGAPDVHVELVWEPPWSGERLSPAARRFMGW